MRQNLGHPKVGPPKRRSKETWGRYPDISKGDVLFNAQKRFQRNKIMSVFEEEISILGDKIERGVQE